MSVSSEIARIKSAKTDIRTAIIGKGVSVPADATIDAYPAYVASIPTGIVPSGTLQIASNGTYDVASFASAQVAVPIPQPSLISKAITSNGTYSAAGDNADGYSEVTVNVSGGGDAEETLTALIDGSISSITNNASVVADYAFYSKSRLTQASFPMATTIGSLAFYSCVKLANISFQNVTGIWSSAFYGCVSLTTVSFPMATSIGNGAFSACSRLATISFPMATSIGNGAFSRCFSLTTVSFPMATSIGDGAFASCISLTTVSFPMATSIGNNAFSRCYHLLSLYLLGSSVATLSNINAFVSTPISNYTTSTGGVYGSIFVRTSLLTAWQTATNWATYSSRFVGLTDAEIEALG